MFTVSLNYVQCRNSEVVYQYGIIVAALPMKTMANICQEAGNMQAVLSIVK